MLVHNALDVIDENINTINSYSFFKVQLDSLYLHKNIKEIQSNAFNLANIKFIQFNGTIEPSICNSNAFSNSITITVPYNYKNNSFCGQQIKKLEIRLLPPSEKCFCCLN